MLKRSFKRQRGAEIVEFLVTLPVILIVFFLVVEMGVAFVDQGVLVNASRAAAREVARGATDADAVTAAARVVPSLVWWTEPPDPYVGGCGDALPVRVCVVREGSEPGDDVAVTVEFDYQLLTFPGFPALITLRARTVMRMLPV